MTSIHQLSIDKQKMIQKLCDEHDTNEIIEYYELVIIKIKLNTPCSYCDRFRYLDYGESCIKCPLYRLHHKSCCDLVEIKSILKAKSKQEFKKWHLKWCKRLGLTWEGMDN